MQCLLKPWIHSREEDANGITVYRPSTFAFPLSRGRDGIEFQPHGTALLTDPGRDDRGRTTTALWKSLTDDVIELGVEGASRSRRMVIVECNDDVLRVRWEEGP